MPRLRDLTPHEAWTRACRKLNGRYNIQPCMIYSLRELAQQDESFLETGRFTDEDFVIPPVNLGRSVVRAKIGKLYIEFCPGGKDSFSLKLWLINQQARTLSAFLNLENPRDGEIKFEELLPFALDSYYMGRTVMGHKQGAQNQEYRSNAYEIKQILTKLLYGQALTEQDIQTFRTNYVNLYMELQPIENSHDQVNHNNQVHVRNQQQRVHQETKRDIQHFGTNPGDKPNSLFEVAAKLGAIALQNLSLSEEEICVVLKEYLEISHQTLQKLQDTKAQEEILNALLDKGRFPLKTIVNDAEGLLQRAIAAMLNPNLQQNSAIQNEQAQQGRRTAQPSKAQEVPEKQQKTEPTPYSFQFKCYCALSAVSSGVLALSLISLALNSTGAGLVILSGIGLAYSLYGFYSMKEGAHAQIKELAVIGSTQPH